MAERRLGVIMNGVTGRMGRNQHLHRSLLAIIREGGVLLENGERALPELILVGRNPGKLQSLAHEAGVARWTTDLDSALSDPDFEVYFDSQITERRVDSVRAAISAGKHVYCEKPTALNVEEAIAIYRLAQKSGVKHGVVQDKLWLPGMIKLKDLIDYGFFGDILSVRGEFGYWVFEGRPVECQRPSWNYRKEEGGGIIYDMFPHWRYLLDGLFGGVEALSCIAATHVKRRWDEVGEPFECSADDAAYATFRLQNGVVAHFNSSWAVRVRRDDLLTVHVDGLRGSAVAGLRDCWIQPGEATPRPVWNPDQASSLDHFSTWLKVPEQRTFENAFKAEWELFIRHVLEDTPFPWSLLEGARGVQLAEKGMESWQKKAWVDIPALTH